jgi:phospholipid/cholesterol/gamma-HCH transport system substrate-binding protein
VKRAIRTYWRWVAVIGLLVVAAAASGIYILINQRLKLPGQERYTLYADLPASTGLAPGLGQAVNVAGVRVGQMTGVKLTNGVARIKMEINPSKLPKVYDNASAALIENTPLKDMLLELGPGGPPGKPLTNGGVIPIERTDPPISSDELTNALDADTRDFFDLLVRDSAAGARGRGEDFNQLLKALEPTTRQINEITTALAGRREELRRLVGNLRVLSQAAAEKDVEIGQVIDAANETLTAVASQDVALQASVTKLPNTLSTVRASLDNVAEFGEELEPTLNQLLPTIRKLPAALEAVDPLLVESEPILRTKLRPLIREARPLVRDLRPATEDLSALTPVLTSAFQVLNYVVNETAYNPPGDEEGFIYWTAWFSHNAASMLSVQDAQGSMIRGLALVDCDTLTSDPALGPLLQTLFGAVSACASGGSGGAGG